MNDGLNKSIKEYGICYAVVFLGALFCYSPFIFGQVYNDADGTWHGAISYAGGWELGEGRWLWPFLDKARAYLSPDPMSSVFSLAVFILGFILVMELMGMRNKIAVILAGLAFIVATPICGSLSYRYMSHVFSCAFLLAVLSAYSVYKIKRTWLAIVTSAVCLALSMGLYQSDLGCTVLIMLFMLIVKAGSRDGASAGDAYGVSYGSGDNKAGNAVKPERTDDGEGVKGIPGALLKCFISVLAGGILYFVMWQEELWRNDVSASSYGGADALSIPSIFMHLPETLTRSFMSFIKYFGNNSLKITMLPRWLYIIAVLLFGVMTVYQAVRLFAAGKRLNGVLMLVFSALIPAVPMCTYILTYNISYMSSQMTVPLGLCFALIICMTWRYMEMASVGCGNSNVYSSAGASAGSGRSNVESGAGVSAGCGSKADAESEVSTAGAAEAADAESGVSSAGAADNESGASAMGAAEVADRESGASAAGAERSGKMLTALKWILTGLAVLIIYGQHLMVQYDTYAMYMGRRSVETIANEVLDELIAEGLYAHGVNYCFIGSPSDNPLYFKNDVFNRCNDYARYGEWAGVSNDNRLGWQGFMMNVLGINMGIASNEIIDAMDEDPRVKAMPVFPLKGSVASFDECVVIKLAEN